MQACDGWDICWLSPIVCVVAPRIDLQRRRSPFRSDPPFQPLRQSQEDAQRGLAHMIRRAPPEEATDAFGHTFEP